MDQNENILSPDMKKTAENFADQLQPLSDSMDAILARLDSRWHPTWTTALWIIASAEVAEVLILLAR